MQLSGFTDLALRIVMRLAVLEDPATTTRTVSAELDVRYTHAAKAVATLQRLGVVETRRGRAGGLRLHEEARSSSVGRLVRDLEGPAEVVRCEGGTPCPLRAGCRLRTALRDAQEAFFAALDPLTIADLVAPPTRTILLELGRRPSQ